MTQMRFGRLTLDPDAETVTLALDDFRDLHERARVGFMRGHPDQRERDLRDDGERLLDTAYDE